MPAYKKISPSTGRTSWYSSFYYTDWTGKKKQKKKEGFETRKAALEYERGFLERQAATPDISFSAMCDLFLADYKARRRVTSYTAKRYNIRKHLLPYFGNMAVNAITPAAVRAWQTELKAAKKPDGLPYSPVSLHEMQATLSSIFNFAVKFHGLAKNPVPIAGAIAPAKSHTMNFWTADQFRQFIATIPKDDLHRAAFILLFFTGIRRGELLAITPADFDFDAALLSISKSYKRLQGKDFIQPPKTEKGRRVIALPPFVASIMEDCLHRLGDPAPGQRIFDSISQFSLRATMMKGAEAVGLPQIRVHDLRHSHASLLIEQGFSPLVIAERLGHESIQTTLDTYSHLYPSKQSEIAEKLNSLAF